MIGTWNHSREGAELRGPRHPVPTTVLPHLAGISLLTADSSNETHVHDPQSSRVWSHSTEQGFHRGDELREPAGLSSVPMDGAFEGTLAGQVASLLDHREDPSLPCTETVFPNILPCWGILTHSVCRIALSSSLF